MLSREPADLVISRLVATESTELQARLLAKENTLQQISGLCDTIFASLESGELWAQKAERTCKNIPPLTELEIMHGGRPDSPNGTNTPVTLVKVGDEDLRNNGITPTKKGHYYCSICKCYCSCKVAAVQHALGKRHQGHGTFHCKDVSYNSPLD